MIGRLRVKAKGLTRQAVEDGIAPIAKRVTEIMRSDPVFLRFPDEIPDEELRLLREAEDGIERWFPLYVPSESLLGLMDDRVATALRARNREGAL